MSIDEAVAAVDLEYSLAIDHEGTTPEGVYVYPLQMGALLIADDRRHSIRQALTAAECIRAGTYLLACGKAAG